MAKFIGFSGNSLGKVGWPKIRGLGPIVRVLRINRKYIKSSNEDSGKKTSKQTIPKPFALPFSDLKSK